jgi:uncharacterized protein YwqG
MEEQSFDNLIKYILLGNLDKITEILTYNKDYINQLDSKEWTPLMYACNENNYELVYYFIYHTECNINISNSNKENALSIACFKKYHKILYLLVKKGAFDFDNLPERLYIPVFYPIFKKIDIETGLEKKIGGLSPYFIKGEKWPINNSGIKLTFLGQFTDPRKNNNILYRIFFDINNMIEYNITKIDLSEENLSKQISLKKTKKDTMNLSKQSSKENTSYIPYEIVSWKESKELHHIESIIEYFYHKYGIDIHKDDKLERIFEKLYEYSSYVPLDGIKIGGTAMYCQYSNYYQNPLKFRNFFQMSQCKELPYTWGDSGIAHVYEDKSDLRLEFDCS